MESWDNLIVQWINCLFSNTADCVQSTEELQDGKIYLKLISKLKRFKLKVNKDEVSEKGIVIQFLKDEYPNFVFGTQTQALESLCVSLLVLSRLSLESTFHKSLCSNLNLDTQIKIKSILESIYPLGKKVTIENLCSTFSLIDKSVKESFPTKPKYLLEQFLNSPAARSVQSDNKIHEQTKQIRHLQADLETVRYEKSELIEDIKIQKKQIDDLHQKLQETLLEVKNLRQDSLKSNDFDGSYEPTTPKSVESSYEKELQSLENYISELQSDNFKLQDEKTSLQDQLQICKDKCSSIETKSIKHEEMIESLLLQIEKKDSELIELKIKYEELCVYLKEKSKPVFINQSFVDDDRGLLETSMNNSEPLSSVIEIQLQDAKKEIIEAQNKYKSINSLLTIIIEEYVNLQHTVQMLSNNNAKIKAEYEEKYRVINEQLQDMLDKEKLEKELQLQKSNELDFSKIKENISKILEGDSEEMKSLLLKFLHEFKVNREVAELNNSIDSTTDNGDDDIMDPEYLNTLKSLQKYQGDKSIKIIDKNRLVFKFYDILWQENWRKNLVIFLKTLLQNNNISANVTYKTSNHEKIIVKYHTIDSMLEKNLIKCLEDLYNRNEADKALLITKEDLESVRTDWIVLYNNVKDNLKMYKVMLFLEKKWSIISELYKNFDSYLNDDIKELLEKKDRIDSELSKMFFFNSQNLSCNLIAATQLTTKLNKSDKGKLKIKDVENSTLHESLNDSSESRNKEDLLTPCQFAEKIVNIKKSIDDFENLRKMIEAKPKIQIELADTSMQTEVEEKEPTVETEYANISIQTEIEPMEAIECTNVSLQTSFKTACANISLQTEDFIDEIQEPQIKREFADISLQTEDIPYWIKAESVEKINISLQTESIEEPEVKIEHANICLQTDELTPEFTNVSLQTSILEAVEQELPVKVECANVSLQTDSPTAEFANVSLQTSIVESVEVESPVKVECANVSLQTDTPTTEFANVCLQTSIVESIETQPPVKVECANVSLQTDTPTTEYANLETSIVQPIEIKPAIKVECMNTSMQTDNAEELLEVKPIVKIECANVSVQTENVQVSETPAKDVKIKVEKDMLQQQIKSEKENILNKTGKSSKSVLDSEEVQNYVKELHEKYELKLEKMKDKMKSVYNSQMSAIKKEQESGPMKKLKCLEEQLEQQCHNHSEELKKYKKHVSDLSTQLWDVGEKLLIEKQKKEELVHKYKELKTRLDIMEAHNSKVCKHESKSQEYQVTKAEVERQPLQQMEVSSVSKMQNVRNFQVMGNAFRTEDEEGELFDTTYNLSELQRSQNIPPANDLDRLSVLQMRNAKCKPHLKSSYAAEMQSYPVPVTEDEIKAGSASEEVFNDSLSQSLLTGKKVKRRDRTRNGSETPRRSTRRFSNIFRKPRLSLDRK